MPEQHHKNISDTMYLRIQWLMIVRLVVISITLAVGHFIISIPFEYFYDLIAFYYLVSILYIILLQRSRHYTFLGFFQITIDLIAVTSIVSYTGPVDSVFPNLYILIIILSVIVFPRYGGAISALASIILYISTVLYLFLNYSSEYIDLIGGPNVTIYVAYIYITIFGAVGYLANYISKILRQTSIELEEITKSSNYVFKHINTGLLIINNDNVITYANNAALRLFNASESDILHLPWNMFFDLNAIKNISQDDLFYSNNEFEINIKTQNSDVIPVSVSFSLIKFPSKSKNLKIILLRDLRQQKNNEQKLLEAERLKAIANLSSTVAHEIGNPLASISGSAELMLTTTNDPNQKKLLKIIVKEVERLSDIVTDFLSFTRLRSIEFSKFDLNNLIMDVVVLLHHSKSFPENMKLIFKELDEPLFLIADSKQLKQAFLNIGLNALDAMPNGGKLEISINHKEKNNTVDVIISDTGIGIPEKSLELIFDSFYTTKKNGSGIGLYVTQKIIQSHNGSISVTSSPEKGTTFRITIPTNINYQDE